MMDAPPKPRSQQVAGGYNGSVGAYCCVPGCKNSRGRCNRKELKLSFYSFPKDKKQKKRWLDRIRLAVGKTVPFEPMSHSRVCSAHFDGGCRSKSPRSKAFFPSIFPRNSSQKHQTKRAQKAGEAIQEEMLLPPPPSFSERASVAFEDKVGDDIRSRICPLPPRKSVASEALQQIINDFTRKEFSKTEVFTTPATTYTEGEVTYTTNDALKEMLQQLPYIKQDTGSFTNKQTCDPVCSRYTFDVHFVSYINLSCGSFGKVDLCYDTKTMKPFVRKTMQKSHLRAREVIVLLTFVHSNIATLFGLVLRDSSEQESTEQYLDYGGDSLTIIYSKGLRFDHLQIRSLTKQGLSGLKYLHDNDIIHHDVKPENICILVKNDSLQLKITGFGSSRLSTDRIDFEGMTPTCMAPEMCQLYLQTEVLFGLDWGLKESDITGKVDVFAFALVVMYMYKGYHILVKVMYNGTPTNENMDANRRRLLRLNLIIQMAKVPDNDFFVQDLIPDECSQDMGDLLFKMTQHIPSTRVSARQAFEQIEESAQLLTPTDLLVDMGDGEILSPFNSGKEAFQTRSEIHTSPELMEALFHEGSTFNLGPMAEKIDDYSADGGPDINAGLFLDDVELDDFEVDKSTTESCDRNMPANMNAGKAMSEDVDLDRNISTADVNECNKSRIIALTEELDAESDDEMQLQVIGREDGDDIGRTFGGNDNLQVEEVLGTELEVTDNLFDVLQPSTEDAIVIDKSFKMTPKVKSERGKPVIRSLDSPVTMLEDEQFPSLENSPREAIVIDSSLQIPNRDDVVEDCTQSENTPVKSSTNGRSRRKLQPCEKGRQLDVVEDCKRSENTPVQSSTIVQLRKKLQTSACEKRSKTTDGCKQKVQPQKTQTFNIPNVVEDCMQSENKPVKSSTSDRLRRKLQPYDKGRHLGKSSNNIQKLHNRQVIASKKLQRLEQALPHEPTVQRISVTMEHDDQDDKECQVKHG